MIKHVWQIDLRSYFAFVETDLFSWRAKHFTKWDQKTRLTNSSSSTQADHEYFKL